MTFVALWATNSHRTSAVATLGRVESDAVVHGYKQGDKVWVEDADGKRHPGVFVGDNEATGWFGGGPSAYVIHADGHQAEVVSVYRITPRDE